MMRLAFLGMALLVSVSNSAFAAEPGFKALFDGKSLDGWELRGKSGEGYVVRDGMLTVPPKGGGNLFHTTEFSDFVLRFEFRLEDGSNNGLCIRCPIQDGSLAYEGIELQIIDNTSERYAKIKPWQKHGSLYHVFPARTGHLRPVGEWNEQEVVVKGESVRVVLNGHVILDVVTSDMKDEKILAEHPGLKRTAGHIGFLGHNEPVEFRKIRIKKM